MEIKITFSGDNAGFEFTKEGESLTFGSLSRKEQIMVCSAFVNGYKLFSNFIKEE